jgi:acyl-CoA synthetase (AMP-forming)/AMP-acid ligase II
VPTMLEMLLGARSEVLGDRRLEHMRAITVGGGVMSRELIQRTRNELGTEVLRMYAMAECMVVASMLLTDPEEERDFYDGRPDVDRGATLAVFGDDHQPLAVGEIGEIGLRAPSMMSGYLGDPDGKASLLTDDGYLLSGDLGELTEDGYIKVVGRKKDMIIRGGYNIDVAEVEEAIKTHADVSKVVVVGYPDKIYGERACAVIETHSGNSITLAELAEHLFGQRLSKEKTPEKVECWPELPLSPDGKILRAKVKQSVGGDVFDVTA